MINILNINLKLVKIVLVANCQELVRQIETSEGGKINMHLNLDDLGLIEILHLQKKLLAIMDEHLQDMKTDRIVREKYSVFAFEAEEREKAALKEENKQLLRKLLGIE